MRAVRRALWRAALFLWIRPRAAKRSSSGCAVTNAANAASASLASSALMTFLTAVRSMERWATLRSLRTTVCLARFLADLILATTEILVGLVLGGSSACRLASGRRNRVDPKLWTIQWLGSTTAMRGGYEPVVAVDRG